MKNKSQSALLAALLCSSLNAADIQPLIGVELGFEGGSISTDYSAPGFIPESYEHDYAGANFRLSGGVAIKHETLESRVKVYLETASGEVEFDSQLNWFDEDYDSKELGISYELVISQEGLDPYFGVELGSGSTEADVPGAVEVDYTSFGLYGGILYPINKNLEFSARIGYKLRSYDDYTEVVGGIPITEESSYSGVDLKVGLAYTF